MKLPGGCRDIVQRFQSVAVVCVRHDWESLCPTQVVMVSKSVTSSWSLHCVYFLPQWARWDLYTFTLGVLLCVRVHAFTSLCVWVYVHMWNVLCTCHNAPETAALWQYEAIMGQEDKVTSVFWLPALMVFIKNPRKKKNTEDWYWCSLNLDQHRSSSERTSDRLGDVNTEL